MNKTLIRLENARLEEVQNILLTAQNDNSLLTVKVRFNSWCEGRNCDF